MQQALGFGSSKLPKILLKVKSIEDFYNLGLDSWISFSIFNKKELLYLSRSLKESKSIYEKCLNLGYKIVSYSSEDYPDLLRKIPDPPCVLYVNGDVSVLSGRCVSIVGSREASVYGSQMAYELARDFSNSGITVVSGCAFGIDSAAHKGAISSRGNTIGVMACGIDYPYLVRNLTLREKISSFGAVISEYPPGYQVQKFNFPVRNRIISGLSLATIIVEAGKQSGAVITANIAAEQGRDVFVVPVDFDSKLSEGINSLINDGVKAITCAEDVLRETYKNVSKNSLKEKKKLERKKINIPEDLKFILDEIGDRRVHINDLKVCTKMSMAKLSSSLMKLELLKMVKHFPGKFYEKY